MSYRRDIGGEFGLPTAIDRQDDGVSVGELVVALRQNLKLLVAVPCIVGTLTFGITLLLPSVYTATTTFMPPVQSQSGTAAALASLGALGSLAGNVAGTSTPADRYAALLSSVNVMDSLIDRFRLMDVYRTEFRIDARRELAGNVRVSLGKKDGLISVTVDDTSPQRAAEMANQHIVELRRITASLAITETQQRRMFFERQLQESQAKLVEAQKALQSSGFNAGAIRAEPRAAAENYARLRAEITAAEVRLQTLRSSLADSTPDVQQQLSALAALRGKLAEAERSETATNSVDYIGAYRNYKYQETLFELYAKQFELARVEESREAAFFQVVDVATPPERRTGPKRVAAATMAFAATLVLLAGWVVTRAVITQPPRDAALQLTQPPA